MSRKASTEWSFPFGYIYAIIALKWIVPIFFLKDYRLMLNFWKIVISLKVLDHLEAVLFFVKQYRLMLKFWDISRSVNFWDHFSVIYHEIWKLIPKPLPERIILWLFKMFILYDKNVSMNGWYSAEKDVKNHIKC